jgi:hypothetical protein
MIDADLDLVANFRSEVPAPSQETAARVYRRATDTRQRPQAFLSTRLSPRARLALALGVAALVLVPAAVAIGGKILDLFEGTPAPPAVSSFFSFDNRMADQTVQDGFAAKFPHVDVSKAHGVIQIQTADGPEDLWAAPNDQGGLCWFINFANDPPGPNGDYGLGSCDASTPPVSNIGPGWFWELPHPSLLTVDGRVYVDAATVQLTLADGSTTTLPVVEGLFLGSLDKGAKVTQITAYDSSGKQVAHWDRPS